MYERKNARVGHNTPIDDALDAIQNEIRKRRNQRAAAGPPRPAHEPRPDDRIQSKHELVRKRIERCRPR